jgi:hypothetical protein
MTKELAETYAKLHAEAQNEGSGDPQTENGGEDSGGSVNTGFYRVVRNGVHIFGITNETTLSGIVQLPIEAGYLDLEGSLETLALSADGTAIQGMFPLSQPFNYPLAFNLDTTRLENGPHYLQASGWWRVTRTNTYESPTVKIDGVNGSWLLVNVSNAVSYPNWIDEVGETNMIFRLTSELTNIDWQVDIYGEAGDFIRSFTNHSDDGLIDFSWDVLDTNGVLRTDLSFASVTTVSNTGSGTSIINTNPPAVRRLDNYPDEGRWIVARADIVPHGFQNFGLFTNVINSIAAMGEQAGGVLPTAGRNFGEAYVVGISNITNWAAVFQSLTNKARNFYWFGHGTPNTIEDGQRSLSSSVVATFLNNTAPATNNTRYRFVWLDGCATAGGSWPAAFALGNRENVSLDSYTTRPGAFAGYTQSVYGFGGHTSVTQPACFYRSQFAFFWQFQNVGVKRAFDDAASTSSFSEAQHLKLFGYWNLRWKQFNSKEEWPP